MNLIVDIHLHSHYARATSPHMNLPLLQRWGKQKGITVLGTGDFTHPSWFAHLQSHLEPAEPGLFKLKAERNSHEEQHLPTHLRERTCRFVLTVEVSCIYSRHGKVRKIHVVIMVPSFKAAQSLNKQLSRIGNLAADGRPILGLDCQELLKMTLSADPHALFVPAHIWTPWFGLFGSQSGFDSLAEAFGELKSEITTAETGLSSDPAMNWRCSDLDQVTLISNSDAHSPTKLGREANVLDCALKYTDIYAALKTGDKRFVGTIEFYPEEGKYHYDGHRQCNVCFSPVQSNAHHNICPVCHRPLVLGVDNRVETLADRPESYQPHRPRRKQVEYIVPLPEILAQVLQVKSPQSKTVSKLYERLCFTFGDEFSLLRTVELSELKRAGFGEVAHAIDNMRQGKVKRSPGYDGVFGTITVIEPQRQAVAEQLSLGL